ncbi:MAG TPA: hypothetical protein PLI12_01425, partial [Acetobacteraceae bacterium]|nr:hypothetical protein [Acetobacteraceae bacterium]
NPLSSWDKETKKLQKASQTMGWHRHDLRRTAATMIGDLGYSTDVTEAILGHQIGGDLSRRYNQSKYRTQAKEALKAFADQMDEIERKARDEVAKAESLAA